MMISLFLGVGMLILVFTSFLLNFLCDTRHIDRLSNSKVMLSAKLHLKNASQPLNNTFPDEILIV